MDNARTQMKTKNYYYLEGKKTEDTRYKNHLTNTSGREFYYPLRIFILTREKVS